MLWCLLPNLSSEDRWGRRIMLEISVSDFILNAHTGHPVPEWAEIPRQLADKERERELALAKEAGEMRKRVLHYQAARLNGWRW
jgi:hypothetical protein